MQSIRLNATFGEASTIHAEYSRNRHSNGTSNYLRSISVRMQQLARHQLSTQSIRSNTTSGEVSTIHAEYSCNLCSNATTSGSAFIFSQRLDFADSVKYVY